MTPRDSQMTDRLETFLDQAEGVGPRLAFDDLRELARLYRLASARLAILRSRGNDPDAINYLNALCVRAYTYLQVAPIRRRRVGTFFMAEFPVTLAATARLQLISAFIVIAGAIVGATIVAENPGALYGFIPAQMYPPNMLEQLVSSDAERGRFLAHTSVGFGLKSIFSASLFVHNTEVGLASFATGILAGVPTLVLDFYNGLILGAFAWIFSRDSQWPMFWAWMLPHAIPELLGIILCSAGGLMIARAVVAPSRDGVAASLRNVAGPAMQMVAAAVPLFIVAAAIESFIRQSRLSTTARFVAAALALGTIVTYVWYVRRLSARASKSDFGWLVER